MPISIDPIANGESGKSVRAKLNKIIEGARDGSIGQVTHEDLEKLVDRVAPAVPQGLRMSSEAVTECVLTVQWGISLETDFAYYDLQLREEGGNWISRQTSVNAYRTTTLPGLDYAARVRAIDRSGNASDFSDQVLHTTARDLIPPAMPIGVGAKGGMGSIWLGWIKNTESDLARYEILESEFSFAPDEADSPSYTSVANTFIRGGLEAESKRYFWVRAVDTSGNVSPWSAGVHATTAEIRRPVQVNLMGLTFLPGQGSGNQLDWSDGTIVYGVEGTAPTVVEVEGSSVVWAGDTLYVFYLLGDDAISVTASLVTLYSIDSVLLGVYKGGTDFQIVEGKAHIDGGTILAQTIGANQLIADRAIITGSIQIAEAIIEDAHIRELSAGVLKAGTALAGSITVDERTLSDTSENAHDPAKRINNASTQIDPGKIKISGNSTLSDWRGGADNTEINGGAIAANTIAANKLTIGNRNIRIDDIRFEHNAPAANFVSWTAGVIRFVDDDGAPVAHQIEAGNAEWTTGTLYLCWFKGAMTITTTASYAIAAGGEAVCLAAYGGGSRLVVDVGRTVIDGANIKTGSIAAEQIAAKAIAAEKLAVGQLSAISADMGDITGGSLNINNRVIINSDGNITVQSASSGARLIINNSQVRVYDENNVLRVRLGVW